MIELDTAQIRADIIREAGANPIGERAGLVWFIDPLIKSTLVMKPEDVTIENVQKKMAAAPRQFGAVGTIG